MTSSASRNGFDPKIEVEETALASEAIDVPSAAEPARPSTEEEASALEANKSKPLQAIIELLHDLAIAVVVCVLLITYVVQAFKVQGTSMSPELGDGQRILVNKFLYYLAEIDRGDVVVFWYPEDPSLSFIKRVIGLPGETIEVRDGVVYVDDHPIDEPYVSEANADNRSYRPVRIRSGHYFVLGDNRSGSNDSRSWGLVPERYIYGKAFLRIWPLPRFGSID
ncbi:MAG TPA: signal peptidase I [Vicinamibacteria bacterium]|nr:signal peptidase I [Vicinamibacteria bacterium]